MARFVDIAGCAVPVDLVEPVRRVRARTGESPISVFRGSDPEALRILHAHGKHSQAEIVNATPIERRAWGIRGIPNPVHRSTHEQRSDGVAYRGPVGRKLAGWQCGMDWRDAVIPAVMAAFRHIGCVPVHPYAAGSEYHHLNLAKPPRFFVSLRQGDRGPRVWLLTHRMAVAGLLPHSGLFFSRHVAIEVKKFQAKVDLTADGIVGAVTWRNIEVAARRARKAKR